MRSLLFSISAALVASPALAQACPDTPARHTLAWTGDGDIAVTYTGPAPSGVFDIAHSVAADEETTTDTFIVDPEVVVFDAVATMDRRGQGSWALPGGPADSVTIRYKILPDHNDAVWPIGKEEIAYAFDGGFYAAASRVLLADYAYDDCPIEVVFDLPEGWTAAAPWTRDDDGVFTAADLDRFHDNGFALGPALDVRPAGGMTLVYERAAADWAADAAPGAADAFTAYETIFGDSPAANFHVFLFEGTRPDGGAFLDSFAMRQPLPARPIDAVVWRHGFAHEALHTWIGNAISRADDSDIEWFTEGFTDYLAIKTLYRTGQIDQQTLEEKLGNLLRRYTLGTFLSQGVKVTEAGANKQQNRLLVYGGGAVIAFLLDAETADAMAPGTFEAALRALYDADDRAYSQDRLIAALDASTHGAASDVIAAVDAGLRPTDLADRLAPHGVAVASFPPEEFYVDLAANPAFLAR